jgi:hypothetical protein
MPPSMGNEHGVYIELFRVIRARVRATFDRGRLAVWRHAPKSIHGEFAWSQTRLMGSKGSMPPYDGTPSRITPGGLEYVLGYLKSQPEQWPCTGVLIVIPNSMI